MDKPNYPFEQIERELLFAFQSISAEKQISKLIAYQCIDETRQIFNLALVDRADDGTVSDLAISNNQDMETVLATVTATIPLFFEKFPAGIIYFQGSTLARTRLYRIIIAKYWIQVQAVYDVLGQLPNSNTPEPFEPNQAYTGFYLRKKYQQQPLL
jgi:hypothetical protein